MGALHEGDTECKALFGDGFMLVSAGREKQKIWTGKIG